MDGAEHLGHALQTGDQRSDTYEGAAASVFAMPFSASAFQYSSVMVWAMVSARSGSVAASVFAMPFSASAFQRSSVMVWAMVSARSGSVAASVFAMRLSAPAFRRPL